MSEEEFGEAKEFVDGAFTKPLSKGSALIGCKCKTCGKVFFPRKKLCTSCLTWDNMEDTALSRRAKIFAWTVSHMYGLTPLPTGYVDLPEGVRLFAQFTDCEPPEEKLKLGMEVEMVVQKMSDIFGVREFIGYKFKPVEG
nr:OB-fold domain-containing protein [Candidatus Njordarchaeum guaymaensis]